MLFLRISIHYNYDPNQESASYSLRAKSDLPPDFVNKSLLEHSYPHSFTVVHGCLCTTAEDFSGYRRELIAQKPKIFTIWPFMESLLTLDLIFFLITNFSSLFVLLFLKNMVLIIFSSIIYIGILIFSLS